MINWKTLPRARGIYQITTGSVSYVGLSDNIQLRVKQHLDSSSCRSRIILDTKKAKIIVLELLPHTDDKTLALREWYWFDRLKRKGHIMVNDPKTLGKTKSGQFFPPKTAVKERASSSEESLGCGLQLAGMTTVVSFFFFFGFFAAGKIMEETQSPQTQSQSESKVMAEDSSPQPSTPTRRLDNNNLNQSSENRQKTVTMQPLSACIRPLQPGTSKQAVEVLQGQLQELGYYEGEIDGLYGPGTQGAVSDFQRDYDLGVDGVVGCDTQVKINEALR